MSDPVSVIAIILTVVVVMALGKQEDDDNIGPQTNQ